MKDVKLYVGTYRKYTEGSLFGAWLDLSNYEDYEEFMDACRELHKDESDPEFMFQDCEYLPRDFYCECCAQEAFNYQKAMEAVEAMGYDGEAMETYICLFNVKSINDVDNLVRDFENAFIATLEDDDNETVGYYAVDNGLMGEIPSGILSSYIDYAAIGRDLLMWDWSIDNGYLFSMVA